MAKGKPQRFQDRSQSSTSLAEPPLGDEAESFGDAIPEAASVDLPPSVPAPAIQPELLADPLVDEAIKAICRDASYSLLDQRNGVWQLLVFGGPKSGGVLREFPSMLAGIEFVRANDIKCRCLQLPGGIVQ